MAGLRAVLFRFRPAGTPGAPTPGAVPGDRAAEADAELAPVLAELAELAELAGVQDEAARIRAEGRARAGTIREGGDGPPAPAVPSRTATPRSAPWP